MGYPELINFGKWVQETRTAKGYTLRQMAEAMGVSAPYLSDVEKGRRMAFTPEKMEQFARILELDARERTEMYELAADARNELPADNVEYMRENPFVNAALRRARDYGADDSDWAWMLEELRKRKGL